MKRKPRKMTKSEAGRLGGKTTKKRHGVQHFRAIGKKGFITTVARHWGGDKSSYIRYLQGLGCLADFNRAFEDRQPNAEGIVCAEMPPLPDEVEDWESSPYGIFDLVEEILASIHSAPSLAL